MGRGTKKNNKASATSNEDEDTSTNSGEATNDTPKNEFEGKNFYEVLGISSTATPQEIKVAYRKKALEVHPDRHPDDPTATAKFQTLGKIYSTLSNEEKRKVYDQTGETDDSEYIGDGVDWEDYWRQLYKKVETSDIEDYLKKYKFSAQEQEDLKKAYKDAKGNIDVIMDAHMHCDEEDRERFVADIQKYIDNGELEEYPAFTKTKAKKPLSKKRAAKKEQEAKEAEEALKAIKEKSEKKGGKGKKKDEEDDLDSLTKQIQARGKVRFDNLFAKYGAADPLDEPPEEAFQQTKEKMERNKKRQADKSASPTTTKSSAKKVKKTK